MTWSSRAVTWSGLFFKVRPDSSMENGLWGGGGRGHGSLELAVPGLLEESVWVWGVFWNWGEGKDWLLGSENCWGLHFEELRKALCLWGG